MAASFYVADETHVALDLVCGCLFLHRSQLLDETGFVLIVCKFGVFMLNSSQVELSMARSAGTRRSPTSAGVRCSAFYGNNNYQALKVRPGATEKEVKSTFRKLALKYHPDVCKGNHCTVRFNQIHEAYENLLDGLKREEERIIEEENYNEYDDYSEDEEWMGYEAAFVFSGGQSQSIYM